MKARHSAYYNHVPVDYFPNHMVLLFDERKANNDKAYEIAWDDSLGGMLQVE